MIINKQQITKFVIHTLMFAFCFIMLLPTGYAAKDKIGSFPEQMASDISTGVTGVIKENLTSNNGKNKLYTYILGSDEEAKKVNGGKTTVVINFANATKVICGFAIIIMAITKYFQELDKGHDPVEGFYKLFAELFLVAFFIINIDKVLEGIIGIGNFIIEAAIKAGGTTKNPETIKISMIIGTSKLNIGTWLQCVAILLIPWVLSMLMQIIALFNCFSLLIELGVRKAFAPIAVCDIYSEGLRSPGVRYLKRFLATFLKIAASIFVCHFGNVLIEFSTPTSFNDNIEFGFLLTYIFKVIAINLTVVGMMNKTGEYANDIVGV